MVRARTQYTICSLQQPHRHLWQYKKSKILFNGSECLQNVNPLSLTIFCIVDISLVQIL